MVWSLLSGYGQVGGHAKDSGRRRRMSGEIDGAMVRGDSL